MGLLFLVDECRDFRAMVAEIAESVKYLGFGDPKGVGYVRNGFAAQVKCGHVPNRNP
jgi:hypothetical protein